MCYILDFPSFLQHIKLLPISSLQITIFTSEIFSRESKMYIWGMTILSKPYCHLLWTGGVLWKLSSILLFILLNVNTCICITDGNVTTDIKNVWKRPKHLNLVYNGTAVQIIQIWKWKQNVWWKPCHTWIQIFQEQKMVEMLE